MARPNTSALDLCKNLIPLMFPPNPFFRRTAPALLSSNWTLPEAVALIPTSWYLGHRRLGRGENRDSAGLRIRQRNLEHREAQEMIPFRTAYRMSSGTLFNFSFSMIFARCVSTVYTLRCKIGR